MKKFYSKTWQIRKLQIFLLASILLVILSVNLSATLPENGTAGDA